MASGVFVSSCHHESEPPTLDTSALIFHPYLPSCGLIHASSLYTSLPLFSAVVSQHIVVTADNRGWRTSLFHDPSHYSAINRRLIYLKALWLFSEVSCCRKNRQTYTSKTHNGLIIKVICSLNCTGGLILQGRRKHQRP